MHDRTRELAIAATATVTGWLLYDVSLVATRTEPLLVGKLLVPSVVSLAVGAIIGFVWGLHRVLLRLSLLAVAAICAGQWLWAESLSFAWIWLPRAILLMTLAVAVAAWLAPRVQLPAPGVALLLGAIAALCTGAYMREVTRLSWLVPGAVACALASTWLPWRALRQLALGSSVAVPLLVVAVVGTHRAQLRRPDAPLSPAAAPAGRPNLLMIILDTVGADHLAPYGYHRITTPRLDSFVRRCATQYTEAYATCSWTLPSHASLLTGLLPSAHGAHHCRTDTLCNPGVSQPLRDDVATLAERLAVEGYQTGAIAANALNLDHKFGLDRGFAHYDDRWGLFLPSILLPQLAGFHTALGHAIYRTGETITGLALDWIAARAEGRPFFLFLNYMDAHGPYVPPSPYDRAFGDERPRDPYRPPKNLFALLYDRKLLYLDEQVAQLLRQIEADGLLDETIVIITSDHGESFGDHGTWWHGDTLYTEQIKVPLYVKSRGRCRSAQSAARMTGADVYDLALREIGLDSQRDPPQPNRIVAELHGSKDRSVAPKDGTLTWVEGTVKWIVSSTGAVEAYDLSVDPREQRNIAAERDGTERARARARDWWAAHPPFKSARRTAEPVDKETRDRMRALGY
jgi:arylsulfatase A-like enzyme